jgi:hypothetical protein
MRFSIATLLLLMTAGVVVYDYFSAGKARESTVVFSNMPSRSEVRVLEATKESVLPFNPEFGLSQNDQLEQYYIGEFPIPVRVRNWGIGKGNVVAPRFGGRIVFYEPYTDPVPPPSDFLDMSAALLPRKTRFVPLPSMLFQVVDIMFLVVVSTICFLFYRLFICKPVQQSRSGLKKDNL